MKIAATYANGEIFQHLGIEVYAGAAGSPDAAVEALLAGALPKVGEATCHSSHAHSHSCANHGGTCHQ